MLTNLDNSNNFKSTMSKYKGALHCEGYDYEEVPENLLEGPFFTRRKNCTVDLMVSCCTVSWASTFLQLRNYYIQT